MYFTWAWGIIEDYVLVSDYFLYLSDYSPRRIAKIMRIEHKHDKR